MELVAACADRIAGRGWLPPALRTSVVASARHYENAVAIKENKAGSDEIGVIPGDILNADNDGYNRQEVG